LDKPIGSLQIDHPKMPKFENLLKDYEAVATSHAVNVSICFVSFGLCTQVKLNLQMLNMHVKCKSDKSVNWHAKVN